MSEFIEKDTANVDEMGVESISKLLIKFSVPAIIGMMCTAAQNIINRIFVGQMVGTDAISALVVCFPIFIIFLAISMLIGIGGTTLTALKLGEQKHEEAEVLLGQSTILIFASIVIAGILTYIFTDPILVFSGASDPVVFAYAHSYLKIESLGMILACLSNGLNNFIRVEGNPRTAMLTQIISCMVVILANYFFVVRLALGIEGAALGNIVGSAVGLSWVLYYFRPQSKSFMKIRFKNFKLQAALVKSILILGIPACLMQLASSLQNLVMNRVMDAYGGSAALAAVGIVMSLSSIIIMPMIGLNQGSQPILGYNYGACNYKRVKRTLFLAALMATVYSCITFVILEVFADSLVSIFGSDKDKEVLEMAAYALRVFFLALPFIGAPMICGSYFQASGKPIQSTIINLSRQVLVYIPALVILPSIFGLNGAWFAGPVSDIASFIICMTMTFFAMRTLNKKMAYQKYRPEPDKIN